MAKQQSGEEVRPYIAISQSWFMGVNPAAPFPSLTEIAEFMISLGFSQMNDSVFDWYRTESNGILLVLDAKRENFIKSVAGVVPIDLIIGFQELLE